jgi:anhydro-N-acetylmuramic acid kinase
MDLAVGGQGAPLATLFHKKVFSKKNKIVAVNNLGGISNVTFLGSKIFSFDTGPANILIDYAIQYLTKGKLKYDKAGLVGAKGIAKEELINLWLKDPFLKIEPPKSTGREDYGVEYFKKTFEQCKKMKLSLNDIVATYTSFTAESIALNYALHLPQFPEEVILCGGGASNVTLRKYITQALRAKEWALKGQKLKRPLDVFTSDELGWPSQSIEASAFALLAFQTMTGQSGNLHQTTGASRPVILGQITPTP